MKTQANLPKRNNAHSNSWVSTLPKGGEKLRPQEAATEISSGFQGGSQEPTESLATNEYSVELNLIRKRGLGERLKSISGWAAGALLAGGAVAATLSLTPLTLPTIIGGALCGGIMGGACQEGGIPGGTAAFIASTAALSYLGVPLVGAAIAGVGTLALAGIAGHIQKKIDKASGSKLLDLYKELKLDKEVFQTTQYSDGFSQGQFSLRSSPQAAENLLNTLQAKSVDNSEQYRVDGKDKLTVTWNGYNPPRL